MKRATLDDARPEGPLQIISRDLTCSIQAYPAATVQIGRQGTVYAVAGFISEVGVGNELLFGSFTTIGNRTSLTMSLAIDPGVVGL